MQQTPKPSAHLKSFTAKVLPFKLSFFSDAWEGADAAKAEAKGKGKGFKLTFFQKAC